MNLGMMYEGGLGVLHSYPKAIEYYKIACDLKSAHACLAISNIYLKYAKNGTNIAQNLTIAKQYAGKACSLGLQNGCDVYKIANESGVK